MKKGFFIFSLFFVTLSVFFIVFFIFRQNKKIANPQETTKPVLGAEEDLELKRGEIYFQNQIFNIVWVKVDDISKINLFSNLVESQTAQSAFNKKACQLLINAGFYSKERKFLGLFISDGKLESELLNSTLFDGIFSINYLQTPRITRSKPQDELRLALQSGPILIENSFIQKLSMRNDKPARRMIAMVTGDNKVIFMSIYNESSKFMGPYLADLPQILEIAQDKIGFLIADAINLDGGSASAFYFRDFQLSEASPIGGFFCVK